jgi:hypothetical protein
VLAKLPLTGEDGDRAGTIVKGKIVHGDEGVEGLADIAVVILGGEEGDGGRGLAIVIISLIGQSRGAGRCRKGEG